MECAGLRRSDPIDLNPIEQVFAMLKLLLRNPAERPVDATWQRTGSLLDNFHHTNARYISGTTEMLQFT